MPIHRSKNDPLISALGHDRSFGDVGSTSGLPESEHDWAIYEYTRKSCARVVPPAAGKLLHA
jgi:hypothetical protein